MNTLMLAAVAVAANAAAGASAPAADTATNDLGRVVVEASRLWKTEMEMPMPVQVITADEIARSGARDVVDLLAKKAPQLHVRSMGGANPAMREVAMGGYGENGFGRVKVVVDGEALNRPDMLAPDLSRISLGSVRRVEILKGPQTVLHGDSASAGLVNVVTEPEGYETHGHAEVRGGSWDTFGASFGLSGGIADTGTQYWFNGGWDRSDGYRANSGYEIWNASGGVRQNFDNGSYLRFSAFYSRSDYDLPRALSRAAWKDDPRRSVQQDAAYDDEEVDFYKRLAFGLNATLCGVVDDENEVKLTFTASRRDTRSGTFGSGSYADYDSYTWSYLGVMDYVWSNRLRYDLYAYRLSPEWVNTTEIAGFANELVFGGEATYETLDAAVRSPTFYHPRYAAPGYVTPFETDYEVDRTTMSLYGQDTFHLTDWLAVQAGGRYSRTWNRYTAALAPKREDNLWAYEGALLFTPVEDFKSYVRFARFYRSPFLDENPYDGGAKALRILDPEKGWHVSGGGEWRFLEEFTVSADAFLSRTEKEIFYNPFCRYDATWGSWTKDNVNSPSPVRRYGASAALSWERDKVAGAAVAYSFVHASFTDGQYESMKVPLAPESTVSATGRVWLWDDCFVFGGYRFQTEMYSISDFENDGCGRGAAGMVPSFGLFHVGVSYSPTFSAWAKGWTFTAVCDNLFDRNYCDYATYGANFWPGAGRSFMFTIRYEF